MEDPGALFQDQKYSNFVFLPRRETIKNGVQFTFFVDLQEQFLGKASGLEILKRERGQKWRIR